MDTRRAGAEMHVTAMVVMIVVVVVMPVIVGMRMIMPVIMGMPMVMHLRVAATAYRAHVKRPPNP
jgi:uncharacterized protein (DUF983 family)